MKKARKAIIFFILICLLSTAAYADTVIDYEKEGRITITLLDIRTRKPVSGVEICLYKVAGMDGNDYVFTRGFRRCGLSLDDLRADRLAEKLADYAEDHELSCLVDKTDKYGEAEFRDLSFGLYLAVQKSDTYRYHSFEPFLICVPMTSEDGREWIYHVEAYPKVISRTHHTDNPPGPRDPVNPVNPSNPSHPSNPVNPVKPVRPPLIQTGLLKWPVPVLAALGTLFFALGWAMVCLGGKHEN